MVREEVAPRHKTISRKHLINSLLTGLLIGTLIGAPIGWFVHRFYSQQKLAQYLLCRERNLNQPAAVIDNLCGTLY